ncbi:universal stress protein [Limimaricola sp.]|uniref:universal stress protein n=1 Tax=Limimaricola sp. TaxID=2211665 RepID=UPI004057D81F
MCHGSVAVLATDACLDRGAILTALALTDAEGAHLDIHCLGIEAPQPAASAIASARDLEARLRPLVPAARRNVVLHACPLRGAPGGRALDPVLRFADRIVAAAPFGPPDRPMQAALLRAALRAGGPPVVVVPGAGAEIAPSPSRLALAWDGSPAAMAAIRATLPMLRRARRVDVVVVDPDLRHGDRSDPGGDLAQFLARNGVRVEIAVLSRTRPRIAGVLQRYCIDTAAEAIVMGADGHSRQPGTPFGGTARDMLHDLRTPLILAR